MMTTGGRAASVVVAREERVVRQALVATRVQAAQAATQAQAAPQAQALRPLLRAARPLLPVG